MILFLAKGRIYICLLLKPVITVPPHLKFQNQELSNYVIRGTEKERITT